MTLGYLNTVNGKPANFDKKILAGEKLHTIRKDVKNRHKAGRLLNHVTGNRTKERNEFLKNTCTGVENIEICFDSEKLKSVKIGRSYIKDFEILAKNDGLSLEDFEAFFYSNSHGGLYVGKIIHWTNLRYEKI